MAENIQIKQMPIDQRISDELFGVLPDGWKAVHLEARRIVAGPNSESYRIQISSPENKPGVATVSDELQTAIRELFLLHKKHKTGMCLARYILENGRKGWNLVSEFEYDD
jgi:hypothetical protein